MISGEEVDHKEEDDEDLSHVYKGYRMRDLVRKKKVLEHLIEMANSQEEESNIEENTFTTHNVTSQRKVVYRGSSPHSDAEIRENVLDFT